MLLGSTEAALMRNFTPISRRPAKCAMRTAWVHSGALRAPLCIQGDVMAHFAGRREVGVKFPIRAASVDPKSTQHTPLTLCDYTNVAGDFDIVWSCVVCVWGLLRLLSWEISRQFRAGPQNVP